MSETLSGVLIVVPGWRVITLTISHEPTNEVRMAGSLPIFVDTQDYGREYPQGVLVLLG